MNCRECRRARGKIIGLAKNFGVGGLCGTALPCWGPRGGRAIGHPLPHASPAADSAPVTQAFQIPEGHFYSAPEFQLGSKHIMMKAIILCAVLCLAASALAKQAELEIIELWVGRAWGWRGQSMRQADRALIFKMHGCSDQCPAARLTGPSPRNAPSGLRRETRCPSITG